MKIKCYKKCRKQVFLELSTQGKLNEYSNDINILQEWEYSQKVVEKFGNFEIFFCSH